MIWIHDATQLSALCQSWLQQPVIALDTEFERSTTFYPALALLQVVDADHAKNQYLIDALTIQQLPHYFSEVLHASVVKVFHAGQEDLEIFSYWQKGNISQLFDTQIAAAYLGLGAQIGYQSLVKQLLGIDLDKSQTRTNWLQRPLTDAQLRYAADDVKYLLPCYEILRERLEQQDRLAWVLEDCQQLTQSPEQTLGYESYYLSLTSAWHFDARQLAVLQALCAWRENYIRQYNLPRSFIAKDGQLLAIVEKMPLTQVALKEFLDYKSRKFNIEEEMLSVMQKAIDAVQQGYMPVAIEKPIALQKKFKPLLQQLKSSAFEIAQQLNLPEVLVLRQKWLEKLVAALLHGEDALYSRLPAALQGWRYEKVAQPLRVCFDYWQKGNQS